MILIFSKAYKTKKWEILKGTNIGTEKRSYGSRVLLKQEEILLLGLFSQCAHILSSASFLTIMQLSWWFRLLHCLIDLSYFFDSFGPALLVGPESWS
eukprot:g61148.t1